MSEGNGHVHLGNIFDGMGSELKAAVCRVMQASAQSDTLSSRNCMKSIEHIDVAKQMVVRYLKHTVPEINCHDIMMGVDDQANCSKHLFAGFTLAPVLST